MNEKHIHIDENGNKYEHTHNDSTCAKHTHSHKETKAVLNRISRVIGHMNAVKKMVEQGRDCSEVLIQLSAVDSAVRGISRVILKDHISTCMIDAVKNNDMETIEELKKAIERFMK